MSPMFKKAVPLALAVGALSPAAAQAKFDLNPPPDVGLANQPPARVVTTPPARGFDWGDAGIGAGAGLGIAALSAGGGLLVLARRRDRRYAHAGGFHA